MQFNICFLTTSVYIGSAIYTAGLAGIQEQFQISQTKSLLGLTLYVLGYGLGPMIWVSFYFLPPGCTADSDDIKAPLSEVPFFGRNPIYIGTLFVFVGLNFGVVYAQNSAMLLAFRFLTGFFGYVHHACCCCIKLIGWIQEPCSGYGWREYRRFVPSKQSTLCTKLLRRCKRLGSRAWSSVRRIRSRSKGVAM